MKTFIVAMTYTGDCCAATHVRLRKVEAKDEDHAAAKVRAFLTKHQNRPGEYTVVPFDGLPKEE
jgi:hypothetical protein